MEFPQNQHYFHKKIAGRTHDFQADREYLSIQRKSNLPVGESRQGPSGGPGMEPAREPGTELWENRQRDSRSTQETGCLGMARESSCSEGKDVRVQTRAL